MKNPEIFDEGMTRVSEHTCIFANCEECGCRISLLALIEKTVRYNRKCLKEEIEKKIKEEQKYFKIDNYNGTKYCSLCMENPDGICYCEIRVDGLKEVLALLEEKK